MFQSKKNIIAGRNPVTEALKAGQTIDKVLLFKNASGEAINEIRQLAKDNQVPVQYVPNEKLNSLTNIQHQGVVAFKSAIRYQDLQQVIDWVNEKGEAPLFLILDGVTDVRNIGAIARTALCCGAHAIIIPDKGVGALNEDAVKTSAGALEQINICRVNSLMKAVDELHLNGIKVFASEMTAKTKVFDLDMKEPVAIVMGGEEKGVYPALMRICDAQFNIPMTGGFESLNVSVATGMILYEAMKQRIAP
ncbi:23S rRNA (guanosine2251-2'-O)-methyltransferase [Filimonas zeae]|uniref:23S rRNA (Guanosine(2251)-2'-O)-methyltransferase RlmB n=1 Tax=Filimonas zeae TaxID=1737353 RepID=A0A917IZ85_9BACT|nr:23S rRNA (guanosine(2251)-2'-O)-methyltransferase RlmB [Filimonas zeae]MDR6338433.1 23S rRNA (guanosine2251-2'-O)-methyltransferase [Filimonas zeae]GGH68286.1 23S rRNA (guanosine(2251)-2'-O)-methyltransferase RlmB [Filimonas zeae]